MSQRETARAATAYAVAWVAATFVGLGIAGSGLVRWVLPAYSRYLAGDPTAVVLREAAPGLALLLVGVLLWKGATTAVLFRYLGVAMADAATDRLDTESMKSDILAVIDERLADMKRDTQRTRDVVERGRTEEAADEFDFPGS